jgi:hypothetical protein
MVHRVKHRILKELEPNATESTIEALQEDNPQLYCCDQIRHEGLQWCPICRKEIVYNHEGNALTSFDIVPGTVLRGKSWAPGIYVPIVPITRYRWSGIRLLCTVGYEMTETMTFEEIKSMLINRNDGRGFVPAVKQ